MHWRAIQAVATKMYYEAVPLEIRDEAVSLLYENLYSVAILEWEVEAYLLPLEGAVLSVYNRISKSFQKVAVETFS